MNAHDSLPRSKGLSLAATLCVALLAVLCSLWLIAEEQAGLLWAGLDAVHAGQAASCVGPSRPAERCGDEVAALRAGIAAC